MSLGALKNEGDLKRWLEGELATPGVAPAPTLPFDGMTFGVASVEWPGGSDVSEPLTIEHGLGSEPSNVQLTAQQTGHTSAYAIYGPVDAKELTIQCIDPLGEPAAHSQPVSWEVKV